MTARGERERRASGGLMNLNLSQLRAFVAVLDEGGFGAAAETLHISQSAVSHAVAALERGLGSAVLTRQAPPRPTAFGERVLPHARAAVAAAAAIRDLADERDGRPGGSLRLAAPTTVCQGLLPGLMTQWRTDFPRVGVTLFEGEDEEITGWLGDGTVDLAVLVDPPPGPGVTIARDRFHALLPADHPLAGEPAVDVADLADDAFLLSLGGCERHIRELHRRAGVPFDPTHRIRDMGTLMAMVRAGIGVSILPALAGAMLVPRLVMVPLIQEITRRLVLTGPPGHPWHPAVTAIVDAVSARPDHVPPGG
ncbi:LysR substrate-binding domain-containing protein [Actinoallomurus sp. NBC_01490]|uniref:LysR family transcriptional regulator n=1 Tax=Actinoallomurus sp. NBC_01490 TaxID=2903557 RepID=UPI002E36F837|nr:LysR substrate-binding domain-containing protein [Actinoallomurus sp. NBC_01490]